MNLSAVDSRALTHIGHDPTTNKLRIRFPNNTVYEFDDVDAEKHEALKSADSIGGYFAANIRPYHISRRIE